jgi:hypothetical protein
MLTVQSRGSNVDGQTKPMSTIQVILSITTAKSRTAKRKAIAAAKKFVETTPHLAQRDLITQVIESVTR